ncbi:hypothetical protein [Streptomyces pinistramenti]|uniref:hypothetical protein n=1 Tax=Streptomyces pinistramenti TaxID=2884812 RepID=UPI001D0703BD|nr:hypothetical protein [Streptomyces pinistramenti]MCB5909555.1 hypothetical protein [Streptomyces pinistramenti]
MADDRYSWLDDDAAERLLRGEPVGSTAGDGARELAQLLDAAAGAAGPAALPGEEAALAAFRTAQAGPGGAGTRTAEIRTATGAGRPERTTFARPFRRALVVALAACAIGGVAVAAGTGVLPTPFRGGGTDPEPGASVSAAVTPGTLESEEPGTVPEGGTQSPETTPPGQDPTDPAASQSPDVPSGGTSGPPTPDHTPGDGSGKDGATAGSGNGGQTSGEGGADRRAFVASLCRDYQAGKRGEMDRDTLRRLERAAGGPAKIHAFCRAYLKKYPAGSGSGSHPGNGQNGGQNGGHDEDDDHHPTPGPGSTPGQSGGTGSPEPSGSTTVRAPSLPALRKV